MSGRVELSLQLYYLEFSPKGLLLEGTVGP